MRLLVQRTTFGKVVVDHQTIAEIHKGLLVLTGFGAHDSPAILPRMAEKLVGLRIFPDERGRFDRSVIDIEGGILLVPQFTLYANCRRGRRPDFAEALAPAQATLLFEQWITTVQEITPVKSNPSITVATGQFGADMKVQLENDGPVTIWLDSQELFFSAPM